MQENDELLIQKLEQLHSHLDVCVLEAITSEVEITNTPLPYCFSSSERGFPSTPALINLMHSTFDFKPNLKCSATGVSMSP